jgi:hypothetical protein
MAYEQKPDDFKLRMHEAGDFDTGACTDPTTGTYLAFIGTVEQSCPVCVTPNTIEVKEQTNRIPMRCVECGSEFRLDFILSRLEFGE